jgi:hypothetical protein
MAKIVLKTSLGNGDETAFMYHGKRIMDISQLPEILEGECNPYRTDSDGALIYFSKAEIEILKQKMEIEEL